MNKKKSLGPAPIWDVCKNIPWYAVSLIVRVKLPGGGSFHELCKETFTILGPDLMGGFLEEHRRLPFEKGHWSIGVWYPEPNKAGPDWGILCCPRARELVYSVQGRADCLRTGRRGLVFQLRGGES